MQPIVLLLEMEVQSCLGGGVIKLQTGEAQVGGGVREVVCLLSAQGCGGLGAFAQGCGKPGHVQQVLAFTRGGIYLPINIALGVAAAIEQGIVLLPEKGFNFAIDQRRGVGGEGGFGAQVVGSAGALGVIRGASDEQQGEGGCAQGCLCIAQGCFCIAHGCCGFGGCFCRLRAVFASLRAVFAGSGLLL